MMTNRTTVCIEQHSYSCICQFIVFFLYSLKVNRGCTTELTHQGYQFFSNLFDRYDEVSSCHNYNKQLY